MKFQPKYKEGDIIQGHLFLKRLDNVVLNNKNTTTGLFKCLSCGLEKKNYIHYISRKRNTHCGCLGGERHGETHTRLYNIWNGMRNRCENKNSKEYRLYGAKGINICSQWKRFSVFKKWADTNGYKDDLTIDRINNAIGYCPENCRWSTVAEQNRNQTTTKLNWEMVNDIRRLACSTRVNDLAKLFYLSRWHVSDIIHNKRWKQETLN